MLKVRTRIAVGISEGLFYWDPDTDGSPGSPRELLITLETREFLDDLQVKDNKVYCIRRKGYSFIERYPITEESKIIKGEIDTLPERTPLSLAVLNGEIYYNTSAGEIWKYDVKSGGLNDKLITKGIRYSQGTMKAIGNKLVNLGDSYFEFCDPLTKGSLKKVNSGFPIFFKSRGAYGIAGLRSQDIALFSPEGKELRTLDIKPVSGFTNLFALESSLFVYVERILYRVFSDNSKISVHARNHIFSLYITKEHVITGHSNGDIILWTYDLVEVRKFNGEGQSETSRS